VAKRAPFRSAAVAHRWWRFSRGSIQVCPSVRSFRFQAVVSSAQESDVIGCRRAAAAERLAMIILEPGARLATAAVFIRPAALDAITLGDLAARRAGDVTAPVRVRLRGVDVPGMIESSGTKASLQELGQEQIERALDDGSKVSARTRMAQQVPRALELILQLPRSREADGVALTGKWSELMGTISLGRRRQVRALELRSAGRAGRDLGTLCRVVGRARGGMGSFRHFPHAGRHVLNRKARCQKLLGFAHRLSADARQQLVGVIGIEMWFEQRQRAERQLALGQQRKHYREAPGQPRRFDPAARFVLAETQTLHTIFEHRPTRGEQVQPAFLHLPEIRDELTGRSSHVPHHTIEPRRDL
jgi:hypothetical protein